MARAFEYWFDFSCPYAYLASTQVEALSARTGAQLFPKPLLLGGVFKALEVPQRLFETMGPAKAKHGAEDLQRWAKIRGVPLIMPPDHPRRTVDALRALLAVGEPFMPLAHRFFRAYWVEGIDLGTSEGVRRVLSEAGHDAERVMARAQSSEVKDELRRRTDEAISRGVFGVPALFVGEEMFFGQDRLDYVEELLGGRPASLLPPRGTKLAGVDFWFDYSSPFSYLAAERVEEVFGDAAVWRPMLLGGLFKAIGSPDVPLFTQSEAKRRHTMRDLERQAARSSSPLKWPSKFPMNTVLPLRVTLLAPEKMLMRRIFRAFWAEDRDISDPSIVRALCDEVGLDGASLVARAGEAKDALRKSTDAAVEAGVFGAPTFVVAGRELFWGADRLDLAARAASGAL